MNEQIVEECRYARKRLFHAYSWIGKNFLKLSLEDRKLCKAKLKDIRKDLDVSFDKIVSQEEWLAAMNLPPEKKVV